MGIDHELPTGRHRRRGSAADPGEDGCRKAPRSQERIRVSQLAANAAALALPSDSDLARSILGSGVRSIVTVPCSITAGLHSQLSALERDGRLEVLTYTHEANLVGLAAGIWFGTGRPALIHLQNSGLPNIGDGIVSFSHPWIFAIPLAALITYRGATEAEESEPHLAIGERTDGLVSLIFGQDTLIAGDRHGCMGCSNASSGCFSTPGPVAWRPSSSPRMASIPAPPR